MEDGRLLQWLSWDLDFNRQSGLLRVKDGVPVQAAEYNEFVGGFLTTEQICATYQR